MLERGDTWQAVAFGDVVRLNRESCKAPEKEGLHRVVGLEHLEPDDLRIRRWGSTGDGTTFTNRFRTGQVLFGKRRAYQRKCARPDFGGVCSGDIYVFETADSEVLEADLLPFLCSTERFFAHAVGTSAGSLSPRTNWNSLAKYRFGLPPIAEQRRFVGILAPIEEARIAASDAVATGEEAFAVLTWQATTGALAAGSRTPVHTWRYARLPGVNDLPRSWEIATLTEVARLESGHTPSKRRGDYWNGGIPWISLADIQSLGVPEIADTAMEISAAGIANSSARILPPGTVVLSRDASIGYASVLEREMATSQHFANFVCDASRLVPRFLYYLFVALREYFEYIAIGSTNVNTIYMPFFRRMQIPLPPISEQQDIVELLDDMWEGLEALRGRVASHRSLLHATREKLIGKGAP